MPGQPRKRMMVAEMERRAKLAETSPLELAVDWVESGKTLTQLVDSLNQKLHQSEETGVTRSMLSRYLNGLPGGAQALAGARSEGSHGMAESAVTIIDQMAEDKVEAAQHKTQAEIRLRLAGFWNRKEYQDQKGPDVNIQMNLGQLHIDALRMREIPPALPAPEGADYEVLPAEPETPAT